MSEIVRSTELSEHVPEQAFGCDGDRLLAPPPPLPELEAFLDKVLCDGRYIGDLHRPTDVARALGVELSPAVAQELATTPPDKLLSRLYRAKFPDAGRPAMVGPGIVVVIVVVAVILITVVVAQWKEPPRADTIKDRSPDKEKKL